MNRLAILFARYRIYLAWCVLAYTAVCLVGLTRVTFDNDPLKLLQSDRIEFKELSGDFAGVENIAVVVVEGDDLLGREAVRIIRVIAEGAEEIDGVEAVHSMLNVRDKRRVGRYLLPLFPSAEASEERFERVRREAPSHPMLVGHFLSEDMKASLVVVQFSGGGTSFEEVKRRLENLEAVVQGAVGDSGLRARVTGTPSLEVEIVESMRRDIFTFSTVGSTLAMVIAVLLFRRVSGALIVGAGPAVGTIWTVGTFGLIGEPINVLTNVVPVLVLVIGFTDSMHLVLHVRRAVTAGSTPLEASQSAIRHLGLACALTSLSTAVGFGSLLVASLDGIQTFGWCCALGSVLSFFAVITVVPLLASTPLASFLVLTEKPGRSKKQGILRRSADRVLDGILARPRTVLGGGVAVTLVLALVASRLEPDHTLATEIPDSSEVYRALEDVDRLFGGVMFAYAVVRLPNDTGLTSPEFYATLEEVHAVLEADPVLSNPLSLLNLVRSLPGAETSLAAAAAQLRRVPDEQLERLVSFEEHRAVVSAHMPDVGARLLKPAFARIERGFSEIEKRHPGFNVELRGGSVAVFKNIHLMIEDLWKSLATAAGVMFAMIWIGLRSLRYALVSLLPNVFPLLCTGALIVISGRYLEMSSVIVFSISLGIAVDDTIHFLVRYKREVAVDGDPRAAIRRTFHVVGTALVMTTVALVAGHAVVMLSGFPAVRVFGALAAVAIASALIGDLLLLPAVLATFAKRPPVAAAVRPAPVSPQPVEQSPAVR